MSVMTKRILIGVVVALLLLGGWFVSTRNSLVSMDEAISASWAQIENQLQRRYDLIPNLVNTVKGYASHEKEIFENIADARSKLAGATTISGKINASQGMESALGRLLAIAENYPNLKANDSFKRLMDELAGSENRIAVERRRYNDNIRLYNKSIRKVPANIVAGMMGFEKKDYFEIQQDANTVPTVSF